MTRKGLQKTDKETRLEENIIQGEKELNKERK